MHISLRQSHPIFLLLGTAAVQIFVLDAMWSTYLLQERPIGT